MQEIKMDMDLGAYLIRWTGGGASPALIWQTENGERMICCSNWIAPAKLANMAGAPVSSIEKIASWAHEDAPQPILSSDVAEIRNALGTLGEGIAEMLKRQGDLQAAGLRGADRGVAILKHLQEIGDNVRGVSGTIGDKFGVLKDAIEVGTRNGITTFAEVDGVKAMIADVGQKVEACMTIASNTEEGLSVSIEKLDKLGVEKWREAIKHVEAEGITEPMHAKVKAADYDESGLGKLWADVPVNLEDVSDETLRELAVSGQISEARYFEEYSRRSKPVDPGYGPRVDTDKVTFRPGLLMRDGEVKFMGATAEQFAVVELSSGVVVILWEGKPYLLRGMALHPLRFVA